MNVVLPHAVLAVLPRPTGVSLDREYFTERNHLVDCGLAQVSFVLVGLNIFI